MYLDYFGLSERPFSIAPDPHYLYMSTRHKEAMAHLSYGLSQGGCFIVLTGEVGTGKTTLCRNLLGDLPDNVDVALILNANINEQELLQTICDELKIGYEQDNSQKQLLDRINAHLLDRFAENRQTVLIIDEAQLLQRDVLEQIRLLTNLETTKSKLLQIILIGQPELNDVLSRNDLRQLAQRVTARYHLGALQRSEIDDYVNFRLSVAGCRQPLFSRQALSQLHRLSGGIPRKINVLADHSLLSAYANTQSLVDAKSVKAAAKDVFIQSETSNNESSSKTRWLALVVGLLLFNALLWWWFTGNSSSSTVEQNTVAEQTTEPSTEEPSPAGESSTDGESSTVERVMDQPQNVEQGNAIQTTTTPDASIAGEGLTTIVRSTEIEPGTMVIADEPLDDSDILLPLELTPNRAPLYTLSSEFGKVLDTSADVTGRIAAFRTLGLAWDVELPSQLIQPACDELSRLNVVCLSITNWGQLQRFNRPAILVVEQGNQLHRVIVFKLDDGNAQVLVGETVYTLSVEELKNRWNGNGITFWRPSDFGSALLQQGQNYESLPKVRQSLNQAFSTLNMPLITDLESRDFDAALARKVFALQSRFSIVSDSKIGNETYLLINEINASEATPVLRQRVE